MSIVRTAIVLLALVLTAGCYRYVPVDLGGVPPGAEIRASLTDAGAEENCAGFSARMCTPWKAPW